jgi:hypothetical protein
MAGMCGSLLNCVRALLHPDAQTASDPATIRHAPPADRVLLTSDQGSRRILISLDPFYTYSLALSIE